MDDEIVAGIQTATNEDAELLGPTIDRMLELADSEYDTDKRNMMLEHAKLLRWMFDNVERVDDKGFRKMWCVFPRSPHIWSLKTIMESQLGVKIQAGSRQLLNSGIVNARYCDTGYIITVRLRDWVGIPCSACYGLAPCGRREDAIGPDTVLTVPIEALKILETEPAQIGTVVHVFDSIWAETLPAEIKHANNLAEASLEWARKYAKLGYNLKGEKYEEVLRE